MNKKVSTLDNNKGFINLRFLQKLNCQKTEWDQARFSSLVKRFAETLKYVKVLNRKLIALILNLTLPCRHIVHCSALCCPEDIKVVGRINNLAAFQGFE